MKTYILGFGLALILAVSSFAQDARFFRISGPVATTITQFTADGYVVWTNAPTNATFTVQTAVVLPGATNWVDYIQIPVTNGVNTNRLYDPNPPTSMALIPAGSFTMGATTNMGHESYFAETPQHIVYVSAFYMDRYEVTKSLWDSVYQWATNHGYSFDYSDSGQGKASNHPAHTMTWFDAVKWCNARSEQEGRSPAYYMSAAQTNVFRSGQFNLETACVNWNSGYRLPTEAEWEKAARGGASGRRFPWGNTITHSQANYNSIPGYTYDTSFTRGFHPTFADAVYPYTSPAGFFAPNGYGLYDMVANVGEWCWDWRGTYSSDSQIDWRGPTSGSNRVFRGGSWGYEAFVCRAANRTGYNAPTSRNIDLGFRCALPSSQ